MGLIRSIADNTSNTSLSHSMRFKRFLYFKSLIEKLGRPLDILDIGGTQEYWLNMGLDDPRFRVTLLNLSQEEISSPNFSSVVGDATDMSQYADRSFDVVYSNSVIEHLFTKENQRKMALEVRRVGVFHFVQTPNYYFPMEPHFLFPGFQFLPRVVRASLLNRFNLGHMPRFEKMDEAFTKVDEIRLLSVQEMRSLFPGSVIWKERFGGLVKSIVAHNFI